MNKTIEDILTQTAVQDALIKYPKAKKIAVENFVWSASTDKRANAMNIGQDARDHSWNAATVSAIKMALRELGKM